MIIQHNITAMNANRQLGITESNLQKSTEKLSSGYAINRAGDNAAGLAISEKMRGQIRGLSQASTNSEDGISLVQTAEGALQETQNILQRMRELAVQAANDTNTDDDREQIQKEINQLTQEVDRIAVTSEFNTKKLLDGSQAGVTVAKDGKASVESTFANGMVSVSSQVITGTEGTMGGLSAAEAKYVVRNDILRITMQRDITATSGQIVVGGLTQLSDTDTPVGPDGKTFSTVATMTSLNGFGMGSASGYQKVIIDLDSGKMIIKNVAATSGASFAKVNLNTGSDAMTPAGEIVYSISNASNLKAGDVMTIKLVAGNKSSAAKENKESLRLQVGANAGQEIDLAINSMKAKDLGIVQLSTSCTTITDGSARGQALSVTTQANASLAINAYDNALQEVSTERAKLGAVQNRLEHTIANLDTSEENLQSSESRIRDVDMADEMTSYSKSNILQQAGTSMLAQANQSNQTVLSLLG